MHLIKALAAGVLGAESGTAELYRRGTSTKVAYYTDFEGTDVVAATTGLAITLDSNGGATVYVNELVDVVVKNTAGSQVRRFVDGAAATAVEVRSQSFTGTNYETAANAAGEPTTLAEVLDSWLDSAGTTNFNVLVNGSDQTVAAAAGATYGMFFNVKSAAYGALGDGATNDYAAINLATAAAAANGGVVFFPPGTYLVNGAGSSMDIPANVSLLGSGANATIIQSSHASGNIIGLLGSPTYAPQFLQGLTIRPSVTCSGAMLNISGSSRCVVKDCYIGGSNATAANGAVIVTTGATKAIRFDNCTIETGGTASKMAVSALLNREGRVDMVNCTFITPASLTHSSPTTMGLIQGCCFFLRDCLFRLTASTAGSFSCVYPGAVEFGSVRGCEFLDSGGATVTCIALGALGASSPTSVWFDEDGNQVSMAASYLTLYSMTHSADGYFVHLGTRMSRYKEYALTTDAAPTALDFINYGVIAVTQSVAAVSSYSAAVGPVGAKTSLLLANTNGTNRVFTLGTGFKSFGGYTLAATTGGAGFEFTAMSPTAGHAWYLTGFSGSNQATSVDSYTV